MAATTDVYLGDNASSLSDGKDTSETDLVSVTQKVEKLNVRKDWYQTDSAVVVTFFFKNLKQEDVSVNIESQKVTCQISSCSEECGQSPIQLQLLYPISPEKSSWKVLPTKIEIKLKKLESVWWNALVGEPLSEPKQPMASTISMHESSSSGDANASGPTYPSSCSQKRDWDRIAQKIQEDEANEKLEGESALNQLFQKIYSEGTDEVKKAMNKSFMESGGTVLSTNWKDVGNKSVQINPPDGMEFKKWDI